MATNRAREARLEWGYVVKYTDRYIDELRTNRVTAFEYIESRQPSWLRDHGLHDRNMSAAEWAEVHAAMVDVATDTIEYITIDDATVGDDWGVTFATADEAAA